MMNNEQAHAVTIVQRFVVGINHHIEAIREGMHYMEEWLRMLEDDPKPSIFKVKNYHTGKVPR